MEAGKLQPDDLARALQLQSKVGDRLGTNLLELGLISEHELLAVLGRQRHTRTVSHQELQEIAPEVRTLIPSKLARRYNIVPFRRQGRTLYIAASDPGDALVEDEIALLTSCMVRTLIGLELRVQMALERCYGVKAPLRIEALARRLDRAAAAPVEPAPAAAEPADLPEVLAEAADALPDLDLDLDIVPELSAAPTLEASELVAAPVEAEAADAESPDAESADTESDASADDTAAFEPATSAPATSVPGYVATGQHPPPAEAVLHSVEIDDADRALLYPETAPSEAVISEAVISEAVGPESVTAEAIGVQEASEERVDDVLTRLHTAGVALGRAEIRDEIGDVLLDFCAPYFQRRLLLIHRGERIIGWRGEGEGVAQGLVRALSIPADRPSVFFGLLQGAELWMGPLPTLEANQDLLQGLGGAAPADCAVFPIVLRQRVVCFLYLDNLQHGVAAGPVAEVRRLVRKAGVAFEVYILKNKIRVL